MKAKSPTPVLPQNRQQKLSSDSEVQGFLQAVDNAPKPLRKRTGGKGRLIFAMDATGSRSGTWKRASVIQADMFKVVEHVGGLDVQLVWYGGHGDFGVCPWTCHSDDLLYHMMAVKCRAGATQIDRVLQHTLTEHKTDPVDALVFVGDCVEEIPVGIYKKAGELGLLNVPAFVFYEGHDLIARTVFKKIARLTGGAFCRFNAASAVELKDLLSSVAVYASGGKQALLDYVKKTGGQTKQIAHQMFEENR